MECSMEVMDDEGYLLEIFFLFLNVRKALKKFSILGDVLY